MKLLLPYLRVPEGIPSPGPLYPDRGRRETPWVWGGQRRSGERDRAGHLFSLCDNSCVPTKWVDQVLDGQFLGEVRQVNEVFTVMAAGVEMKARNTWARPLEGICFTQIWAEHNAESIFSLALWECAKEAWDSTFCSHDPLSFSLY